MPGSVHKQLLTFCRLLCLLGFFPWVHSVSSMSAFSVFLPCLPTERLIQANLIKLKGNQLVALWSCAANWWFCRFTVLSHSITVSKLKYVNVTILCFCVHAAFLIALDDIQWRDKRIATEAEKDHDTHYRQRQAHTWCEQYLSYWSTLLIILYVDPAMVGVFRLPCKLTRHLEHPASIPNKMTTIWMGFSTA